MSVCMHVQNCTRASVCRGNIGTRVMSADVSKCRQKHICLKAGGWNRGPLGIPDAWNIWWVQWMWSRRGYGKRIKFVSWVKEWIEWGGLPVPYLLSS